MPLVNQPSVEKNTRTWEQLSFAALTVLPWSVVKALFILDSGTIKL